MPRFRRLFTAVSHELKHPSGKFNVSNQCGMKDPRLDGKREVFQTILPSGESIISESHETRAMVPLLETVYRSMLRLKAFDETFKQAQRQGRIPFFVESRGEEAAVIASAAALDRNDHIFSQYREHGALLWRGASMESMAHQCCGTRKDSGKGRQMPMHFGDKERNFHTISSPLSTQLLHATGFAYVQKKNTKNVVVCYFGEGAASEGDFHAALNFACTLECPVLFICRNNGWSITTPTNQQYAGDGIVSRASGYGIPSCRVDGGDARAVYIATRMARDRVMKTSSPFLIECMTHRLGDHSTSDDSRKYVPKEVLDEGLQHGDPIPRLLSFLSKNESTIDAESSGQIWMDAIQEARAAISKAEKEPIEPISTMFDDVYDVLPYNLEQQKQELAKYLTHMLHA